MNKIIYHAYMAANATREVVLISCLTTLPLNRDLFYGALTPDVNVTECKPKGVGFFYFDQFHPTTAHHAVIAAAVTVQFKAWGLYK